VCITGLSLMWLLAMALVPSVFQSPVRSSALFCLEAFQAGATHKESHL
jgi:hypothetical protein